MLREKGELEGEIFSIAGRRGSRLRARACSVAG